MSYTEKSRTEDKNILIGDIQAKPDPKNVHRLMGGDAHVSYAAPGYLLFVRDNNLMAQSFDARRLQLSGEPFVLAVHVAAGVRRNTSDFSVSANGVLAWRSSQSGALRQLTWLDRSGGQIQGFEPLDGYGVRPRLSPDGNRIAISIYDPARGGNENIWLLDPVRGSKSRFASVTGDQYSPVWSPDGRRIVFGIWGVADHGLYLKDSSGAGHEEMLLKTARFSIATDWSRDGRFILFDEFDDQAKTHMWVLPMFGERKPAPVFQTDFTEENGVLSPDGRLIAYDSDESGRGEVYVRSFSDGVVGAVGKWLVSTAGGLLPRWRP